MKNRRWLLNRRPSGQVGYDDFVREETQISPDNLQPGEILLRHRVLLCAPTMRNWMSGQENSLFRTIDLGTPVLAPGASEVVASRADDHPVGMQVTGLASWQDYEIIDTGKQKVVPVTEGLSLVDAMGPFGLNPQTAYFGMLRVGRPENGENVLVSGAAGSTGSTAAQIAKIKGCRVVGIAGGEEKCRWLVDSCGLDAAIDYKRENVRKRIAELFPEGIDVFYDNVGGETLQAAVDNIAKFGRIVLCGQIASYLDSETPQGPRNMMRLVYGSVRMQGFVLGDYLSDAPEAIAALRQWADQGRLAHRIDLREGFDRLPETYGDLFRGANRGTLLVDIGND